MLARLSAAVDLLRPRTLFRTLSRVDTIADRTRELSAAVDALRVRTDQLLTIQRVDWDLGLRNVGIGGFVLESAERRL